MEMIWIVIALIVAAMVFIFLEILTPMFGALAAMGIAAIVGAAYLTFTVSSVAGVIVTGILVVLMPAYTYYLVKYLPRSGLGRQLFLGKARRATAEATPEAETLESLVGRTGTTETPLRPVGAIRIDGKRVPATAESGMIEKGQAVRVVRAGGTDVVVRKIDADV